MRVAISTAGVMLALFATPASPSELVELKELTVRFALLQPSTLRLEIAREVVEAPVIAAVSRAGIAVVPWRDQPIPRGPSRDAVPLLRINVLLQKAPQTEVAAYVEMALEQDVSLLRRRDSWLIAPTWHTGTVVVAKPEALQATVLDLVEQFSTDFLREYRAQNPRPPGLPQ